MSKKIKEISGIGGTASATPGAGEQVMGKVRIRTKKIKENAPILAGGKVKDIYAVSHFGYKGAPSIPNRKSKAVDYKKVFEEDKENIPEEINENYHRFKNETSKRTLPEQMHKAVKAIKTKLQEVAKLLEYTQQLKSEITEGSEDFKYMKHTERTLEQITETIKQIYIKSKKIK